MTIHPFVELMRRYCIDYTNSHDLTVCDTIMEPDYVVHISGFDLTRDESYRPAVADLFERAPGLGLVVHEFVVNEDRLCMRFSEHAAMPTEAGVRLACWRGIGLYQWNGTRLTENWVEQDHLSMHAQLAGADVHALEPPHLDPWLGTHVRAADASAEDSVRRWLLAGDLSDAADVAIDDTVGGGWTSVVDAADIVIDDLFSAGSRVPFHVTMTGPYAGGIVDVPAEHQGQPVTLHVAGIADVNAEAEVIGIKAATSRMALRAQLTGASPI